MNHRLPDVYWCLHCCMKQPGQFLHLHAWPWMFFHVLCKLFITGVPGQSSVLRLCPHTHCSSSGWPPNSEIFTCTFWKQERQCKSKVPRLCFLQSTSNLCYAQCFSNFLFPSFLGVRYGGISCPHTKFYRTVQKTRQSRDGKATQPLCRTLRLTHTVSIERPKSEPLNLKIL